MLAAYGNALIVRGMSLALDCFCCFSCDHRPCVGSDECDLNCQCLNGECSAGGCSADTDCPLGYICQGGVCVPACGGENCVVAGQCHEGCDCVDGSCRPKSDLFYCVWATEPVNSSGDPLTPAQIAACEKDPNCNDLPEKICRRGPPEGTQVLRMGPFGEYQSCCVSGCGCSYQCDPNGFACLPAITGEHAGQRECEASCGEPGYAGRCCKSVVIRDNDGKPVYVDRGPNDLCPTTRAGCQSDGDTYRSFNPLFSDCNLCPTTQIGACCLPDGTCQVAERTECENRLGGIYKGNSWIDCTTARDPDVGLAYDFACEGCNAEGDCACENDEKCDGATKCVSCGDTIELTAAGNPLKWTSVDVEAGDTVKVYHRNCVDGKPAADRVVTYAVDDRVVTTIHNQGEFVAPIAGTINMQNANRNFLVCITVVEPCRWPNAVDEQDTSPPDDPDYYWYKSRKLEYDVPPDGDRYVWNPGYPDALPDGWRWVYEAVGAVTGVPGIEANTSSRTWKIVSCEDGVFTDRTAEAVTGLPIDEHTCSVDPTAIVTFPNGLVIEYCDETTDFFTCQTNTLAYEECWSNIPKLPGGLYPRTTWGNVRTNPLP